MIKKKLSFWAPVCLISLGILLSQPLRALGAPPTVTVMTLNLHNGLDSSGKGNLDRFLELAATEQPDLIALQEVERKHLQTFREAGYQVIPGMNANLPFFRFGNVILTKHTIVYHRHLYLPSNREQRGLNEAAIEINGQYFRVVNIHLGLGYAEQKQQLDEISRITSYLNEPLLIMGDFNLEPSHSLLKGFPFQDIGSVFGLPKTFPTRNPKYRLDLIWYSRHWEPLDAKVLSWDGSDHLPVTARFELKEASPLPLTAVGIPDLTRENNPLLPDPGEPMFKVGAGVIHSETDDNLTGKVIYTWNQQLFVSASYDSEKLVYTAGFNKIIDLRDYFSLMGARGKGQWSFGISGSPGLKPWYTWEQYYRWNSHWGTKLIVNTGNYQPDCSLEEFYLPSERYRCSLKLDTEKGLEIGFAVTPDKRQVFEIKWLKEGETEKISAGWSWMLNSANIIK